MHTLTLTEDDFLTFQFIISTGPTLTIPKQSSDLNKQIIEMEKRRNLSILDQTNWKWH